jgi:hypothetical protein
MRTSSLFALLLLAACGQAEENTPEAKAFAAKQDDDRIPCAHGDAALEKACTVERAETEQGLTLTVRHPDGAFRRLLVTKDGRGVVAADGAETAKVSVVEADGIEVALGGDRYRLPATVKGQTAAR